MVLLHVRFSKHFIWFYDYFFFYASGRMIFRWTTFRLVFLSSSLRAEMKGGRRRKKNVLSAPLADSIGTRYPYEDQFFAITVCSDESTGPRNRYLIFFSSFYFVSNTIFHRSRRWVQLIYFIILCHRIIRNTRTSCIANGISSESKYHSIVRT